MSGFAAPFAARRVAIADLPPPPPGTQPPDPQPMSWPAKDPVDVLDYIVDVGAMLQGDVADVVAGATVGIVPPNELLVQSVAADGDTAVLWLTGGVSGTTYVVHVRHDTAAGRVIGRAVLLPVQALDEPDAPASALMILAGAALRDPFGNAILTSN